MVMVLMEMPTASHESAAAADRLSELPDGVLQEHVLSRLTSLQAARTSVLSRRWRHLWRDVPCLDIDLREFLKADECILSDDDDDDEDMDVRAHRGARDGNHRSHRAVDWCRLMDFADHATTMHAPSTPLDALRLRITPDAFGPAHRWIRRSLTRRPAEFHLRCDSDNDNAYGSGSPYLDGRPDFSLHSRFTGASTGDLRRLRRLHLRGVSLNGEFEGTVAAHLPALEDLRLEECDYRFGRIASRSLTRLAVDRCRRGYDVDALALAAPRLAWLRVHGPDAPAVAAEDEMPTLVAASLTHSPAVAGVPGGLVSSLRAARILDLSGFSTAALLDDDDGDAAVAGDRFPAFRNLRTLLLDECDVGVECQVLRGFLRNAPELETLALRYCGLSGGSRSRKRKAMSDETPSSRRRGATAYECKNLKRVELEFYEDHVLSELADALGDISREVVHPIENSGDVLYATAWPCSLCGDYKYTTVMSAYVSNLAICNTMSSSTQTLPLQAEPGEDAHIETNTELYQHFTNLVSSLPSFIGMSHHRLYRHEQGWYAYQQHMIGAMVADACFAARPTDIFVATTPKSGTTWMKALLYATVHRREHPIDAADHPFNSFGPHECIRFLEFQLYTDNTIPSLDKLPAPRLFSTHLPFMALPRTIVPSGCKIVYVCRDPKDAFVSTWSFANKFQLGDGQEPISVETAVELFCDGLTPFGPLWDNVLSYWHAHIAYPERVLFFRYEEMQRDPAAHVRRLAEFVGCPFSTGEEEDGTVHAIVRLCGFEHMSALEVTKSGKTKMAKGPVENGWFFRRGEVGDWVNHLTPRMAQRIDAVTEIKFKGSGLSI
ncbi:hypothetical protein ACP70R_009659 [Stipagrostis hirtigluma subsp. patula]